MCCGNVLVEVYRRNRFALLGIELLDEQLQFRCAFESGGRLVLTDRFCTVYGSFAQVRPQRS